MRPDGIFRWIISTNRWHIVMTSHRVPTTNYQLVNYKLMSALNTATKRCVHFKMKSIETMQSQSNEYGMKFVIKTVVLITVYQCETNAPKHSCCESLL